MKYLKLFETLMSDETGNGYKSINLIKIDSRAKTVNLIKVDNWSYEKIYELIGHGCRFYECPFIYPNEDTLYTDEEFLVKEFDLEIDDNGIYNPVDFGFVLKPFDKNTILFGNGLIIGTDNEVESTSVKSILLDIRKDILFVDKSNGDTSVFAWNDTTNQYTKIR